jgi:hypothetical protein
VSTQAFLGCIPLIKRFLLKLGGLPGCYAHEMGVQREQDMSPMAQCHLIMLSQPVVFRARHGCDLDAREEAKKQAILRHPEQK